MSSMPEKVEKEKENQRTAMMKKCPQPLRIAEVIYGTKDLSECMESIIRIQKI